MKFAVIPLESTDTEFVELITGIDPGAFVHYHPKIYFVQFSGSAASLAARLGFAEGTFADGRSGTNRSKSGIVIRASDYFGYGNVDMWSWLDDQ